MNTTTLRHIEEQLEVLRVVVVSEVLDRLSASMDGMVAEAQTAYTSAFTYLEWLLKYLDTPEQETHDETFKKRAQGLVILLEVLKKIRGKKLGVTSPIRAPISALISVPHYQF